MASRCGATRGSCPITTQSALTSSKPGRAHAREGGREQHERVGTAVRLVVGGKERADVREAGGAEQRVGQRMGDDVAVGVPDQPARMVDRDAAEHERNALAEGVGIDAEPDP